MRPEGARCTISTNRLIEEFRANHGVVGGGFAGSPVVLLTTSGARTGAARVKPLVALREGDRLYVFASKGGSPRNPDWYYNLLAHPDVVVEFGDERYDAVATPVTGPERDRIYAAQVEKFPDFGEYEKVANRVIPVV